MRTIKEINKEIEDIKDRLQSEEMKKAAENSLRKRVSFLRECIRCIETNPKETFLAEQIKMIENKINLRMGGFDESAFKNWSKKDFTKVKKAYEKEYDIPKLKAQVAAMKFLLK